MNRIACNCIIPIYLIYFISFQFYLHALVVFIVPPLFGTNSIFKFSLIVQSLQPYCCAVEQHLPLVNYNTKFTNIITSSNNFQLFCINKPKLIETNMCDESSKSHVNSNSLGRVLDLSSIPNNTGDDDDEIYDQIECVNIVIRSCELSLNSSFDKSNPNDDDTSLKNTNFKIDSYRNQRDENINFEFNRHEMLSSFDPRIKSGFSIPNDESLDLNTEASFSSRLIDELQLNSNLKVFFLMLLF